MKRLLCLLTALLMLTACSPSPTKAPFPPEMTRRLLETEAFSEPLEPLEAELAFVLYGLEDAGLSPEQLIGASVFRSFGATCEEVALLTFADEASAQTAANALDVYVASQIQTNKDYRPAELPKLEQAFLERRGTDVLLMVANDYKATYELLVP